MTDRPGEPSLLDDLERHVRRAHWTDAARALQSFVAAHESVHDGYRDVVARILTRILEQFGPDAVEQLNEAHATWQGLEPIMSLPPRDLVRRIADINHWHMSRFRVIEDEQKVTFLLQPCGSGGRLINEGRYYLTGDRPYALMPRASRSTFSMPDFPVYCNHCSEMSRTILTGGGRGWLIEGWTPDHRFGGCRLHVFKSYARVTPEFFTRLDIHAPTADHGPAESWFSPQELLELSTPLATRLARAIEAQDASGAQRLIETTRAAWESGLLPGYRTWTTELYAWVRALYGPDTFSRLVRDTAFDLFSRAQAMARGGEPEEAWHRYWRCHGALLQSQRRNGAYRLELSAACLFAPGARGEPFVVPVEPLCESFNAHFAGPDRASTRLHPGGDGRLVMLIGAP